MSWLSVDLQFFAGEKTEKATPRKRQEVRKKGQVAKSADVTAAFLMLIVFLVLSFFFRYVGRCNRSIISPIVSTLFFHGCDD